MKRLLTVTGLAALMAMGSLVTGCRNAPPTYSGVGGVAVVGTNSTPQTQFFQLDTNGILSVDGFVVKPSGVEGVIRMASSYGAEKAIQYDPNSQSYLQAVCESLNTALANGAYDPVQLNTALSTISIKEARNPSVIAGVKQAFDLYSSLFGAVGASDISSVSPYLQPGLQGLAEGICPVANAPAPAAVSKALKKAAASTPAPVTIPAVTTP